MCRNHTPASPFATDGGGGLSVHWGGAMASPAFRSRVRLRCATRSAGFLLWGSWAPGVPFKPASGAGFNTTPGYNCVVHCVDLRASPRLFGTVLARSRKTKRRRDRDVGTLARIVTGSNGPEPKWDRLPACHVVRASGRRERRAGGICPVSECVVGQSVELSTPSRGGRRRRAQERRHLAGIPKKPIAAHEQPGCLKWICQPSIPPNTSLAMSPTDLVERCPARASAMRGANKASRDSIAACSSVSGGRDLARI